MTPTPDTFKQPVSVLVVIHTPAREVLLLERIRPAGFWQSVTGSLEPGETPLQAAMREVAEETGITPSASELRDWKHTNHFEICDVWRPRYAPDVTHNTEHVFSLCIPAPVPVTLSPDEHAGYVWLPQREAADRVLLHTNRDAILRL